MRKPQTTLIGLAATIFLLLVLIWVTGVSRAPADVTQTVTHTSTVTTATTVTVTSARSESSWEVYFSPKGGAADRLIYWLDRSNTSICAMIYSFTNDDISAAFIAAKRRGVDVKLVMDNEQLNVQGGEYPTLVDGGVKVRVDRRSGIMHNKVVVIDGKILLTGSYNWSSAAENVNRENLLVIKDSALASIYQRNCEKNWGESTP